MNLVKQTVLPQEIRAIFRLLPALLHNKQKLVLLWVLYGHIICDGKKQIKNLAENTGSSASEWKIRRLFHATSWCFHALLEWMAEETMKMYPPPKDGVIRLIADGGHKEKKGKKNEVNQHMKKNSRGKTLFGFKFLLLVTEWSRFKFPIKFRLLYPKGHPKYKTENELFREMLDDFKPPSWVKIIIVICDNGFSSKENLKCIIKLDKTSEKIVWRFVFSLPKTWKTDDGKFLKDLVKHTNYSRYHKVWINKIDRKKTRKAYWVFKKSVTLRHIGDVTIVLSKKRPNASPKKTKIIVTNLQNASERDILMEYQRRWPIEIMFRELKSGLGLGDAQIEGTKETLEKAAGMSVLAYLLIMIMMKNQIIKEPWRGIFYLKSQLRMKFLMDQSAHSIQLTLIQRFKKAA